MRGNAPGATPALPSREAWQTSVHGVPVAQPCWWNIPERSGTFGCIAAPGQTSRMRSPRVRQTNATAINIWRVPDSTHYGGTAPSSTAAGVVGGLLDRPHLGERQRVR